MNFNSFVTSLEDIERCATFSLVSEVLIEPAALATQGKLTSEASVALAKAAKKQGLRSVLVWDRLLPERALELLLPILKRWEWQAFDAVRVVDIGAAWWLQEHHPTLPIQLVVETGSHNKHALLGWCDLFGASLERLVLSIELPKEKIVEYCQDLPVQCEVMGVGRILLFHSPRSLLLHQIDREQTSSTFYQEAIISSENSNNRPFSLLETQHGTLMFLDKDQFILDRLEELWEAGLYMVRLDLRHLGAEEHAADMLSLVLEGLADPMLLRKQWPRKTRAPFFKANRTTAQFSRMKSKTHAKRDHTCLAEVVGTENGKWIAIQTMRDFETNQHFVLRLPNGEQLNVSPHCSFRDIHGEQVISAKAEQLLLMGWLRKTCTGALLHLGKPKTDGSKAEENI